MISFASPEKQQQQLEQQQQQQQPPNQDVVSHKFIFGVIFSRCQDVSATVRAKALQTLAEITAANNPIMVMVIQDMFKEDGNEVASGQGTTVPSSNATSVTASRRGSTGEKE